MNEEYKKRYRAGLEEALRDDNTKAMVIAYMTEDEVGKDCKVMTYGDGMDAISVCEASKLRIFKDSQEK